MLQALRIRDFRLLWGAGLVSSLGSWLLVLAVPAHVFLVTGSLAATGLTLAAEYLPLLLLGPVAGALADRWDRRRLMIAADLLRAGVVALMLLAISPGSYWIFYLTLAAESSGTALFMPALRARIPAIVGTGTLLSSANALNAGSNGAVRLVGGPLGGVLFAAFGIRMLIGADVLSYLVSAGAILMTSRQASQHASRTTIAAIRRDLTEGMRVLRAQPVARVLFPVTIIFLAANASLSSVLIPFGVQRLGGSRPTGFLLAALGVGFLLGAPALRVLLDRIQPRYLLAASLTATAIAYFLLFQSSSPGTALPAGVAVGMFGSMSLVIGQTTLQRVVPDAILGRVGAVFMAGEAAATLAGAVAGPVLASAARLSGLAAVASLATLTAAALAFLRLPACPAPPARPAPPAPPAPPGRLPPGLARVVNVPWDVFQSIRLKNVPGTVRCGLRSTRPQRKRRDSA
jgi:MFS family permease